MPDLEEILIFIVILFVAYIYIGLYFERKRKQKEYENHHRELTQLRDNEIGKPIPSHMITALKEFEEEYKSSKGNLNWNEVSPLTCYGYRVGKSKGKPEATRREIIYYTWYAAIPSIIPITYAKKWGAPGTYKRYKKINSHIDMLARQQQNRINFEIAVAHWLSDTRWFTETYLALAQKYREYGYGG